MKYRVMSYDGTLKDFETEAEARVLYAIKNKEVEKAKLPVKPGDPIPSCNIHKCYHDETPTRSCEIIEEYKK